MNKTIKILIGDENEEYRQMIIDGLKECLIDFEVETAADGVECLRRLQHRAKPDIMFLDLNMPLKDGLDCLRDMNRYELIDNVAVVIYSSSQKLKLIKSAADFGARFYLIKPNSVHMLNQLLQYVFRLLKLPKQEQLQKQNFVVAQQKLASILNYQLTA